MLGAALDPQPLRFSKPPDVVSCAARVGEARDWPDSVRGDVASAAARPRWKGALGQAGPHGELGGQSRQSVSSGGRALLVTRGPEIRGQGRMARKASLGMPGRIWRFSEKCWLPRYCSGEKGASPFQRAVILEGLFITCQRCLWGPSFFLTCLNFTQPQGPRLL